MDKQIERIVQNNPTLDGAEVITMTITRDDRSKRHYYIFKMEGDTINSRKYIPLPFDILSKRNGNGRHSHYIVVTLLDDGYIVFDLNKERTVLNLSLGRLVGLKYEEAEEIVKFQRETETDDSMPF